MVPWKPLGNCETPPFLLHHTVVSVWRVVERYEFCRLVYWYDSAIISDNVNPLSIDHLLLELIELLQLLRLPCQDVVVDVGLVVVDEAHRL